MTAGLNAAWQAYEMGKGYREQMAGLPPLPPEPKKPKRSLWRRLLRR